LLQDRSGFRARCLSTKNQEEGARGSDRGCLLLRLSRQRFSSSSSRTRPHPPQHCLKGLFFFLVMAVLQKERFPQTLIHHLQGKKSSRIQALHEQPSFAPTQSVQLKRLAKMRLYSFQRSRLQTSVLAISHSSTLTLFLSS